MEWWRLQVELARLHLEPLRIGGNQHLIYGDRQCQHYTFTGYGPHQQTVPLAALSKARQVAAAIAECKQSGLCYQHATSSSGPHSFQDLAQEAGTEEAQPVSQVAKRRR
jgi:hypothetical protein